MIFTFFTLGPQFLGPLGLAELKNPKDLDLDPAELGGVVSWAPPPLQLVPWRLLAIGNSPKKGGSQNVTVKKNRI
jgi:hypothetical protein